MTGSSQVPTPSLLLTSDSSLCLCASSAFAPPGRRAGGSCPHLHLSTRGSDPRSPVSHLYSWSALHLVRWLLGPFPLRRRRQLAISKQPPHKGLPHSCMLSLPVLLNTGHALESPGSIFKIFIWSSPGEIPIQ